MYLIKQRSGCKFRGVHVTVLLRLVLYKLLDIGQIRRHIAKGNEPLQMIHKGFSLVMLLCWKHLGQLV